jgi:hypothetical protein
LQRAVTPMSPDLLRAMAQIFVEALIAGLGHG